MYATCQQKPKFLQVLDGIIHYKKFSVFTASFTLFFQAVRFFFLFSSRNIELWRCTRTVNDEFDCVNMYIVVIPRINPRQSMHEIIWQRLYCFANIQSIYIFVLVRECLDLHQNAFCFLRSAFCVQSSAYQRLKMICFYPRNLEFQSIFLFILYYSMLFREANAHHTIHSIPSYQIRSALMPHNVWPISIDSAVWVGCISFSSSFFLSFFLSFIFRFILFLIFILGILCRNGSLCLIYFLFEVEKPGEIAKCDEEKFSPK